MNKRSNESNKRKKLYILLFIVLIIIATPSLLIAEKIHNNYNNNFNNVAEDKNVDIFAEYYDQAENLLQTMTLEEKVGQIFIAEFPDNGVIEEITKYNPGGYILYSDDFEDEDRDSITNKLQDCQNASKINLLIGVDEEGGSVVRVSSHKAFRSSKFESPQKLYYKGGLSEILNDSNEKSLLLKSLGINMNLTPVADVPTETTSFIYDRSYGKSAEETAEYISEVIKQMNEDGMISTMKHFPGYGDNIDTHTGVAIDNREYNTFKTSDFLPFASGIDAGGPCILVNHNIVTSMDQNMPASLSKNVHDILRNELNFSGVIITDNLRMNAVRKYANNGEAAVDAVLAGNDMIITNHFIDHKQEVLNAVNDGRISEETIDKAVLRILSLKYKYNIIE